MNLSMSFHYNWVSRVESATKTFAVLLASVSHIWMHKSPAANIFWGILLTGTVFTLARMSGCWLTSRHMVLLCCYTWISALQLSCVMQYLDVERVLNPVIGYKEWCKLQDKFERKIYSQTEPSKLAEQEGASGHAMFQIATLLRPISCPLLQGKLVPEMQDWLPTFVCYQHTHETAERTEKGVILASQAARF